MEIMMPILKVKKIRPGAKLPKYAHCGDSGMDLFAFDVTLINPGEVQLISTGLAFEIPYGYELQIRPRSGLSFKYPNYIANSPGTVDSGYRGEVKILIVNNTDSGWFIYQGGKIAQAVLCKVETAHVTEVEELTESKRGENGFGSTGP